MQTLFIQFLQEKKEILRKKIPQTAFHQFFDCYIQYRNRLDSIDTIPITQSFKTCSELSKILKWHLLSKNSSKASLAASKLFPATICAAYSF